MLTRNNGAHTLGAYTEVRLEADHDLKAAIRRFKPIINNLNYFLVKNLKKKRKSSPIQRISVEINDSFQKFLISNYEVSHKFKVCNDFLFDLNLETERLINISNLSNCKYFVKPGSFMIKLNKKSRLRYTAIGENPKILEKNPSISVKFISSFSSLTLADEAFLSSYLN